MFTKIKRFLSHPHNKPAVTLSFGFAIYLYLALRYAGFVGHSPDPRLAHAPLWVRLSFVGLGAIVLALLWGFFFAQFVFPSENLWERGKIFELIISHVLFGYGRALSMRNGRLISRKGELRKFAPGVMALDTASAAVLRTMTNFTRAVGPSKAFLGLAEFVDTAFDLRLHSRTLGPYEGEDPFLPQAEGESDEQYEERQNRRWSTSAKTRDGVEVVARITVIFHLDDHPDGISEEEYEEGRFRTELHGHAVSAWRAAISRPIDMEGAEGGEQGRLLDWGWIPPYIAVDIWRESLQRFSLEELFRLKPRDGMEEEATALEIISKAINERLTKPKYHPLAAEDGFLPEELESREYRILQEHGIRVKKVVLADVFFPPAVERELVERWAADWLARARNERETVEKQRRLAAKEGEEQAVRDLGQLVISRACDGVDVSSITPRECAVRLVEYTAKLLHDNPELFSFDHGEVAELERIAVYLREDNGG